MTIQEKKAEILRLIKQAYSSDKEVEILEITDKVLTISDAEVLTELSQFILKCDLERNKKIRNEIFKKIR